MPRISPTTIDVLRAAGAFAGIALIVAGTYDSRWTPLLGCLAVAALSTTEYALARTRRFVRAAEEREARRLAELTAEQTVRAVRAVPAGGGRTVRAQGGDPTVAALTADGLLRLLEAVHSELLHANAAAAEAQAELADLTREWNTLVQESMGHHPCAHRAPR
ncbi:hypothetical protein GCM10010441_34590 [Kitasatospora paracochleata]|uniref:Uncharacterized protein n=1 Tax=Kitasatospora paracochleata TaxID=58354 RepID=A0ABT1IQJ2_9ACTN|nr:hypothetical protein [Kitasatospora paracochleata]MCP2307365.1 hypothetical protein [Kitasatospora paracochleata]